MKGDCLKEIKGELISIVGSVNLLIDLERLAFIELESELAMVKHLWLSFLVNYWIFGRF